MSQNEIAKNRLLEIRRRMMQKAFITFEKRPEWYQDMLDLCTLLEWSLKQLEIYDAQSRDSDHMPRVRNSAN